MSRLTVAALRIDVSGMVVPMMLPGGYQEQQAVLRELLGGSVDRAAYHPCALMHVHDGDAGTQPLEFNLVAWALASSWRQFDISYGLYGTVVVTGPGDEELIPLESGRARQVYDVGEAVREVQAEWEARPPVGEAAARDEVLAAARFQIRRA